MKRKLKKAISLVLLAVLVLMLSANTACSLVDSSSDSESSSTALPTPVTTTILPAEDSLIEYTPIDQAFDDMEALLDELEAFIESAETATTDCDDIVKEIEDAISDNSRSDVLNASKQGEEILDDSSLVYESLLDALEAVQTHLDEINNFIADLAEDGQDTSSYSTEAITDAVTKGESTANGLSTAMTALEEILDDATESLSLAPDVGQYYPPIVESSDNSSGQNDFFITAWANSARYVRYTQGIDVIDLYVVAAGDSLSYQWFKNSVNANTGGTPIDGALNKTYKPLTQDLGITYYYCVVYCDGFDPIATPPISVEIMASQPSSNLTITTQPNNAVYMQRDIVSEALSLSIEATGNNVKYQWYITDMSGNTLTPIQGDTQNRYAPPTDQVGEFYYLCAVSDSNAIPINSNTVKVQVLPYLALTSQPQGAQYTQNEVATPLTVVAEGENLSYQWYIDSDVPEVPNTLIEGATQASYTPPTDTLGTVKYFCEVSSMANNLSSVSSSQSAAVEVVEKPITPSLTANPESVDQQDGGAFPLVNYTYNLGVAQADVSVQFTLPSEYGWTPSVLTKVEGAIYTGTTDENGQISFTMTINGLDSNGDYAVSATDSAYSKTVTATITVNMLP